MCAISLRAQVMVMRVIFANQDRAIPLRIDDIAQEVFLTRQHTNYVISYLKKTGVVVATGSGGRTGYRLEVIKEHKLATEL